MEIKSNIQAEGDMSIMGQIISSVMSAAPLVVASTLLVTGLNADLLDGQHGSYYQNRANHTGFQAISTITGLQSAIDLKANASDLSGYVSKTVPGTISSNHNFTGEYLTLPPTPYHNLLSNTAYVNYYPVGGNGAAHSFVNFRVYDATTGGNRVLALGGDDTFTWNGSNVALQPWVTSQNYITASSSNNLTNKTGLLSMWTNDMGYVNSDTFATTLGGYMSKTVGASVSAAHNFTGHLTMPGVSYSNTLDGSNVIQQYFPEGGSGSNITVANLRVGDGLGGYKAFRFGGNGELTWNGVAIPTLADVINHFATDSNVTFSAVNYRNLTSNYALSCFYPVGGNGANNSFAHFRVWDVAAGTQRALIIGGDNTFTWGGANVALQPWVTGELTTKENSFSKGDIVQGSGVTLSGILTGRLVGLGNITISSSGSSAWADITGKPNSLEGYGITNAYNQSEVNGLVNTKAAIIHTHDGGDITSGTINYYRLPIGAASATIAAGNDSRITNGQTAYDWGNHAGQGYLKTINSGNVTGALGYTPMRDDRQVTINGWTQNLKDNPGWTIVGSNWSVSGTDIYRAGGGAVSIGRSSPIGGAQLSVQGEIYSYDRIYGNGITCNIGYASYFDNATFGSGSGESSALVLMNSTSKGFIPPRMTESQMMAIVSPANGLKVYVTGSTGQGDWTYHAGFGWRIIATRVWVSTGVAP